jgi:hypothetical protein
MPTRIAKFSELNILPLFHRILETGYTYTFSPLGL